jgi:two-component system, NarL family, response regulator LiaR
MPPEASGSLRVLIADDHRLVRQGLAAICQSRGGYAVVGEAANGQEAVEMAVRLRPDVILMDVTMPVLDGVQATAQIMREIPSARIIMLTVHDDDQHVYEAIRAGARGYLVKDTDWQDLIAAIAMVAHGMGLVSPGLAARVLDEYRQRKQAAPPAFEPDELSPSEMEVLQLVAQGADNATIMARLHLSEKSVTNRLVAIYSKLGVSSRTQAALVALRRGWARLEP